MTSTTQTQQNNNNADSSAMRGYLANFLNKDLFINNLKRNKIFMIIITVVLGFCCPLIGYLSAFNGDAVGNTLAQILGTIVMLLAMLFAVILALNAMNYTHGKISSIFFNSLPIKKTCLFTTQFISGIVYFFIPLIAIYFPTLVIFVGGSSTGTITMGFVWAALLFILTYSFVVLAANISGTMFNSLIVFGYFNLYLISLIGMVGAFMSTFYNFTDPSFIFTESLLTKTSPMIYYLWTIFSNNIDDFSPKGFIIAAGGMILISAIFYAVSLYLNKINRTENAGKSINFKIFERIFKYSMLALTAIVGGTMFASMGGDTDFIMFFFGILIFVFISFMLMNFIISRNIREVFKGMKTLGIFTAIACVIMFTFALDIFGIDKYMPNINSVDSVQVNVYNRSMYNNSSSINTPNGHYNYYNNSSTLNINDPAAITLMYDIFDTAMNSDIYDYRNNASLQMAYHNPGTMSLYNISFKLKNGKTVSKNIPSLQFYTQEEWNKFDSLIAGFTESDGFKKAYFAPIFDDNLINKISDPEAKANINLALYYRADSDYRNYGNYISSYAAEGKVILNQNLSVSQLMEVFSNAKKDIMLFNNSDISSDKYYPYSVMITISSQADENESNVKDARVIYEITIGIADNNKGTDKWNFDNLMDYLENNFKFAEN